MATYLASDGLTLHYTEVGEQGPAGRVVLALHGFTVDGRINFVRSGMLDALVGAGHRVVLPDARGHGSSDKPTDPERYSRMQMTDDVRALVDHLGLESYSLVGYSMGGQAAMRLGATDPRADRVVLIGLGKNGVDDDPDGSWRARRHRMIAAFEAGPADTDADADPGLDGFPVRRRVDGAPFAAILRARDVQVVEPVPPIPVPVLMVVGTDDREAGDPTPLASMLDAELVRVPTDHFKVLAHPDAQRAVVDFLAVD
jgi:pimeloyl-ACP methyl ester carboxylesterase